MNLTRQDCKTSRADSLTPRVQSKTPGVEGKYPRKDSLTRKIDNKTPRKVLKTEVNCKTDKLSIRFSSNSGSSLNQDLTKSTIKEESNESLESVVIFAPHPTRGQNQSTFSDYASVQEFTEKKSYNSEMFPESTYKEMMRRHDAYLVNSMNMTDYFDISQNRQFSPENSQNCYLACLRKERSGGSYAQDPKFEVDPKQRKDMLLLIEDIKD